MAVWDEPTVPADRVPDDADSRVLRDAAVMLESAARELRMVAVLAGTSGEWRRSRRLSSIHAKIHGAVARIPTRD